MKMKYEIFINGGFANTPKKYDGEVTLTNSEKKVLLQTMGKKPTPLREIHDGFIYHVKLYDGDNEFKSVFDEHNIPGHVRKFIEAVIKTQ